MLFLAKNANYREAPCRSFGEFIDSYLGIGEDIYQKVREEGDAIVKGFWENKVKDGILYWGIGSGKSTLASIMTVYIMHLLLCLKDPHKTLGIMNDKPIAVINMAPSQFTAKHVVFTSIVNFINNSEWFSRFDLDALGGEVRFFKTQRFSKRLDPQKPHLIIFCGNSKETMPVGLNVYAYVIDEFAFFLDTKERSNAKDVRDMLRNRQTSRFGLKRGMSLTISSARYENDAMDSLYKENKNKEGVYCTRRMTWEMKDASKMSKEHFDFVVKRDDDGKIIEKWEGIPIDFRRSFNENAEKAMRDFGCVPSLALSPFDKDAQVVVRNVNLERENPLREDGSFKDWFRCDDGKPRYFHIDLAKTKDAVGLVVGCENGFFIDEDGEERPKVYVDLIMRIEAPEGGEILFSDVRQVLYSMMDRGFDIVMGTFDGWQSIDSIQILNKKGIETEVQSVDRTTEAYDTLKSLLHLNVIDYYRYNVKTRKGERVDIFEREYMSLELINAKKVDHPEEGSKDVSDAMAGMVTNVIKHAGDRPGLSFI